jgi:hypothetical protein
MRLALRFLSGKSVQEQNRCTVTLLQYAAALSATTGRGASLPQLAATQLIIWPVVEGVGAL